MRLRAPCRFGLVLFVLAMSMAPTPGLVRPAFAANPIVTENQQLGSTGWQLGALVANDTSGQIKGYASATTISQSQSITFYVTVNPVQTYTIDFYRIGWYAGQGGRLRLHVGALSGTTQPVCPTNASTGMIACNWTAGYTLSIPSDWTSGVYVGVLTNAQGYQNYVTFVVRDGRPAPFLYQQSVTTFAAYNNYPADNATGKSLYTYNSYGAATVAGDPRAVKVSFDRPYTANGAGQFFSWEVELVRWLERSGYDVTYTTNVDTHTNGAALKNSKAFLSAGHDEYWSKEMFDAAQAARDAGVSLAFFGGNEIGWQIRFESSSSGVANRVVVCYRDATIDPVQGPTTTVAWRDPPANRPEQTLSGLTYIAQLNNNVGYVVSNSSNWVYAGTGFRDGDVVPGIVGYEADGYMTQFPAPTNTSRTLLSQSPFTDAYNQKGNANSSIYQVPGGAWVFATGTMSWSWGLDNVDYQLADARIQQATTNVLNAFLAVPPLPALQLSGVQAGTIGPSSAVISWQTNNLANSRVDYGLTTAYGSSVSDATRVTGHALTLPNLTVSTTYHYKVTAVDALGQTASSLDGSFTTSAAPTGWAWVQGVTAADAVIGGGSYTQTIVAPASGNFLALSAVLVDSNAAGTPSITAITDNGSPASSWARAVANTDPGLHNSGEIWYAANVTGRPTTITVTMNRGGSTALHEASRVDEYSGVATSAPLDRTAINGDYNVTVCPTGTTAATTVDQELAVALYGDNTQDVVITSPTGWTQRRNSSSVTGAGEVVIDRAVPVGTQSATFTTNWPTWALSAIATFKIATGPPPLLQVSGVQAGNIGPTSAVISWQTNNAANSRVDYGLTAAYGSSVSDATSVTGHSLTLPNLTASTTYHYKVTSVDGFGQTASSLDGTFTTGPPLQVTGVSAGTIGPTSAVISWQTNYAANSRVDYGVTTAYGSSVSDPTRVSAHSLTLSNLTASTTYHYKVTSVDALGQTASSVDGSFITQPPPPLQVSGVQAGNIGPTSAVISWQTNNAANSRVDYGLTTAYGSSVSDGSSALNHALTLPSLTASTTYHYKVTSVDGTGQTASSLDGTFTTSLPLQVSGVQAGSVTTTSVVISWQTNYAANSRVDYGLTSAYGSSVSDATSVAGHALTLSNLTASTTYHYKVTSVDASGQTASSPDGSFTTNAAPKGWAWVQGVTAADAVIGGSSYTQTIAAPAGGNFLVLSAVLVDSNAAGNPSITSISDNGSPPSSWVKAVANSDTGLQADGEIWYAANVTGRPTIITVTLNRGSATAVHRANRVDEYSGIAASAPLDRTAINGDYNVTVCPTGTTAATTVDQELAVALYGDNTQDVVVTSPAGWTERRNTMSVTGAGEVVIDRAVPIGAQSATFITNWPTWALTAIATFKPAP
jgi:hypothetical protein